MWEPNKDVVEKLRTDIDKLYFRSGKLIASNGQIYASHADREANIPMTADFEYHKVIDSPLFWRDMDFCTFVKKL
jgi:hypothetical protein